MEEYIVDSSQYPWKGLRKEGWPEGIEAMLQRPLTGAGDEPEVIRTRHAEGYGSEAHFHLGAQFQLILSGGLLFHDHRIEGLAIHYTDHNVPYGPFVVTEGHDMLVVHAHTAAQVLSKDPTARHRANRRGRQIVATPDQAEWAPEQAGGRRKVLIDPSDGPSVEIVECPPGGEIDFGPAKHGRYEVVLEGTAAIRDQRLERASYRFVRGAEGPEPLEAGPEGVTVIAMQFDQDAEWRPD